MTNKPRFCKECGAPVRKGEKHFCGSRGIEVEHDDDFMLEYAILAVLLSGDDTASDDISTGDASAAAPEETADTAPDTYGSSGSDPVERVMPEAPAAEPYGGGNDTVVDTGSSDFSSD